VRITAQLVDVSDGAHIWSETYDRTMTDIFAVQDDVAAAIFDALRIHVGTAPTRGRPTENPEAYTLFLKARVLLNAQNGRDAIVLLRRATELDPNFGEGYELLAYSYWQQAGTSIPVAEAQRLTGETAAKALDINPDLAIAAALYRAMGQIAIDAYEQAWRAQPGNTILWRPLIIELTYAGYHREAHRYAEQFVELDPLSSVAHFSLGETLYATGQTTEALAPLAFALELDNQYAKWFFPAVHLAEKHDDSAIAQTEAALERDGISDSSWVRDLVAGARDPVNGQAYLDRRIPQIVASMPDEYAGEWQLALAGWYLFFGYLDRYYELIFEAGPPKTWTDADLHMWKGTIFRHGGFTAHPKYLEAAESFGIIDVWEQRGPPDFCEKVGGEWVCN
jgi:tetratricopeptide (TPR) repeat protein